MDQVHSSQRLKVVIRLVGAVILLLTTTLFAQAPPPAPPIMLGTAWYPEQWPESRWDEDLTLMQQAGIRMVRVGEFAWSRMEPSEGHYDLDWLDHAITAAAKHGIYTVVGTPTAAPPAWLTQKYPETLRIDEEGRRAEHGNRQQFNFANPKYRGLARKIAEQMAGASDTIPGFWAGKLTMNIRIFLSIPIPKRSSSSGSKLVMELSTT
jgi:beta-galactosidase